MCSWWLVSHLPNLCLNVGWVIVFGVGPNEVNRIVVKVLRSANTAVLAFTLLGYTGRVNFGSLFVRHLGPFLHKWSLNKLDHWAASPLRLEILIWKRDMHLVIFS